MKSKFRTRDYTKGDFDGVRHLWNITDMGNPQRGDDEAAIEESIRIGGRLIILEENPTKQIAGTCWLTYDGRRIHMHHFGIMPDFQGLGLSGLLMEESLKYVRKKGCQVKLEVHRNNVKAIHLYQKAGFKPLGDYDVYIIRDISRL